MNPETALFAAAADLPVGGREAYLDEACAGQPALRVRIEGLLRSHDASGFMQEHTVVQPGAQAIAEQSGDRIGHYRLEQPIGEGGFGVVWMANQLQPVTRRVALKIIKPGMDTREVIARFAVERQALAMMDHPGIAKVFDAGITGSGRPYFVMELIEGSPVTRFCDERQLDTAARLRLVVDICLAVQHAHQKGIIHRDLKPSNILVTLAGDQPAPKVIDFGIAKAIGPDAPEGVHHTLSDQFVGTPAFMSPEQAGFGGQDIDTRSDVYALGVLLYQLLTGTTPFESKTSRGVSMEEIRRIIRDEEPPPPSTAVGRMEETVRMGVLRARKTALGELHQLLRRDLDWIVMRALEKDRSRRYESAAALAADIRRFLAGEPVLAHPPTFSYRTAKFIRRRKFAVGAAAAVFLSLAGGLAASAVMYGRERDAVGRETAARARATTESVTNAQAARYLREMLAGISPEVAQAKDKTLMRILLAKAADRVGTGFKDQPEAEASLRDTIGSVYFSLGQFNEAKEQWEAGLAIAAEVPGPKHRLTLNLRGNLASILSERKDYAQAEAEHRAILEIRMQEYGPDDPESLAVRGNLANAISKQPGRFEEALKEYRALLPVQTRVLTAEHPDALRTRMAIANITGALNRGDSGKMKEVEAEYREFIALMERAPALGPDDPETLEARYGLADVIEDPGEAEQEHRAVWELRQKVLDPGHKKTLQSRSGIGRALVNQRKLTEAFAEFRAVLDEQERQIAAGTLRPDSKDVNFNRLYLAGILGRQGRHDLAEAEFRSLVTAITPVSKPNDPALLSARFNLACALAEQSKFEEAETIQRDVLKIREETLPAGHRDIVSSQKNLYEILAKQGRDAEAAEIKASLNKRGPNGR